MFSRITSAPLAENIFDLLIPFTPVLAHVEMKQQIQTTLDTMKTKTILSLRLALAGAAALLTQITFNATGQVAPPTFQFLKSFGSAGDGAVPTSGLMKGADGALYGTTL